MNNKHPWYGISHKQRLRLHGKCIYCYRIGDSVDAEGQKCWEHLGVYKEDIKGRVIKNALVRNG